MSKIKYPQADALAVAKELCVHLKPYCQRLIVAGSLRRRKSEVGDVEILYVPTMVSEPDGLFGGREYSLADHHIDAAFACGMIAQRKNVRGSVTWGAKNKLARHIASGIPVDFFATTEEAWWNYLVCRTGPAESNIAICQAAAAAGWRWNPYGPGFTNLRNGDVTLVHSERDVFDFVGLPYKEPHNR